MTKVLAALLTLFAFAAVAFAQAARPAPAAPASPPIRPPSMSEGIPSVDRPNYSHSITGKLLMTNSADQSMVIKVGDAPAMKIIIDAKTRKTADKKTEFEGRKALSFSDYRAGQTVKVTLRATDNKVLEVRVKPTPK